MPFVIYVKAELHMIVCGYFLMPQVLFQHCSDFILLLFGETNCGFFFSDYFLVSARLAFGGHKLLSSSEIIL